MAKTDRVLTTIVSGLIENAFRKTEGGARVRCLSAKQKLEEQSYTVSLFKSAPTDNGVEIEFEAWKDGRRAFGKVLIRHRKAVQNARENNRRHNAGQKLRNAALLYTGS